MNWRFTAVLIWAHTALAANIGAVELFGFETSGMSQFDRPTSTYERLLPLALRGDAGSQNCLGYMFFHGEGVRQDYAQAHRWFHRSAEQGYALAQRNLSMFHAGTLGGIPARYKNRSEAGEWSRRAAQQDQLQTALGEGWSQPDPGPRAVMPGEGLYLAFCAGCHGLNGIAYYVNSPSFALGERLDKQDGELERSIRFGMGVMPEWDRKLSREQIRQIVVFIRTLQGAFQKGIANSPRDKPDLYFRFRPLGEDDIEWIGADPLGVPLHIP